MNFRVTNSHIWRPSKKNSISLKG
uniref:Uncharacterized protein n=1 Tax=Rhizophora mucronata TaxID=61149 RepID=A0A2P2PJ38_RHIMU